MMIPALSFPDMPLSFGDTWFGTPAPDQPTMTPNEPSLPSAVIFGDNLASRFATSTGAGSVLLQSLDVPVYAVQSRPPHPAGMLAPSAMVDPNVTAPVSAPYDAIAADYVFVAPAEPPGPGPTHSTPPGSGSATLDPTATPAPSAPPSSDATQLQRSHDLLQLRNLQTAAENLGLREASRAGRADVERAGAALHEVLAMPEVRGEVYARLLGVAKMLLAASGRLR